MARILIILPQTDYDPAEVALPWLVWGLAGHEVSFATQTGEPATCDPVTLSGEGLPLLARSMRAKDEARLHYGSMLLAPAYARPLRWDAVKAGDFDALHFPGGHAPGMKPYCDSPVVQALACDAFAANQPVSAICHGVLPLARAGVLKGRKTTALTAPMEEIAVMLTGRAMRGHYRTYPTGVETEVKRLIGPNGQFRRGPLLPRYACEASPEAGFVVEDGAYVSARWPGDAWTLALRLMERLV
jgi:protease I